MPASPSARDRILDAFEELLTEQSERAATLDAVAARAGVSKGGLLYHFASKDAMVAGVLQRLEALVADDLERMRTAPAGPLEYFVRSSVSSQSALDRTVIATARLAQGADTQARKALGAMQSGWLALLEAEVGDPIAAKAVMLIGDGIYYNSALLPETTAVVQTEADMDRLVALVLELAGTTKR
ncbi:TetR/AcrR family transcriptional regulator [Leifsonia poae]|uniref:TetR/AcrR family transcriptional regulator n=1 Tax=Leifsonia poae TaxID=110933 RepID=UPI0021DAD3BC|nr:TetR/AcrR family transcriptional regulator [Leifsonia poae]